MMIEEKKNNAKNVIVNELAYSFESWMGGMNRKVSVLNK